METDRTEWGHEREETSTRQKQLQLMMQYAAELELEVDRLRRRDQFMQQHARDYLGQIASLSAAANQAPDAVTAWKDIAEASGRFKRLLRDIYEPPGYHPAFDQVIAIAVRPLAEQVFRWQQHLNGADNAVLRLDLQPDHIHWFPARLRHILDNLMSNALRYRDDKKGEIRVGLELRLRNERYEFRFTDNGLGMAAPQVSGMLELFYRAAPTRIAGLGVGLAVVKMLVEQCCGTVSVTSGEGKGTSISIYLPRYDVDDYVD